MKNALIEDIDQEAEYMLEQASELRQEQEDEGNHLNEVRSIKSFVEKVNCQCQISCYT